MASPQDPGFKDSKLVVSTDLIGANRRYKSRTARNNASYNYALRQDWGTRDRFRGVLGQYYTRYRSNVTGQNLMDYASDNVRSRPATDYFGKQVSVIPLNVQRSIPAGSNNAEALMQQIGPLSAKYLIELNNEAWNMMAFWGTRSHNQLRKVIEEPGWAEGDPQWGYYLKGANDRNDPAIYWGKPIPPIFDNTSGEDIGFRDYNYYYLKPSPVKNIREKSGMKIGVEPVYNYYADTTPPYENISQKVSEPMLVNFYCLESEARNTGSYVNSQDYFNQVTLDGQLQNINIDGDPEPDPWFENMGGGRFSETTTAQYYTLYSKGVSQMDAAGELAGVKSTFEAGYKNIVILNSDLEVLNDLAIRDDDTTGLRNLPFYNKITIGIDYDAVQDPNAQLGGQSFISRVMEQLDATYGAGHGQTFVDLLQMYIVQNYLGPLTDNLSLTERTVKRNSSQDASDYSTTVIPYEKKGVFDLEDFLQSIEDGELESLVERIAENETQGDNFILLRNYNQGLLEVNADGVEAFKELHDNGEIVYPDRDYDMIFHNKRCYNEPVMYVIEKYIMDSQGNTVSDAPVQTFFISRSFPFNKEVHYIDSQVKYGVRYRYDISQIRLVFGNHYYYDNLELFYTHAGEGNGRAVANALGFYKEPDPSYILDNWIDRYVKEYASEDEDLPYSAVGIEGPSDALSIQSGYYIFRPADGIRSNATNNFRDLFLEGTNFVSPGDDDSSADMLKNLRVKIKDGFGFDGNSSGGAVGASITLPDDAAPTGGTMLQAPAHTLSGPSSLGGGASAGSSPGNDDEDREDALSDSPLLNSGGGALSWILGRF